jgi:hypothetical protein
MLINRLREPRGQKMQQPPRHRLSGFLPYVWVAASFNGRVSERFSPGPALCTIVCLAAMS